MADDRCQQEGDCTQTPWCRIQGECLRATTPKPRPMTDSPTSQAMHLAMTELREREERIAELETALRLARRCMEPLTGAQIRAHRLPFNAADIVDAVLNKETNRG